MIDYIKRLLARFGFGKRLPQMTVEEGRKICDDVDQRLVAAWKTNVKNIRLAQIARERNELKYQLTKAITQKKARRPIYAALEALTTEELRLESGQ